MTTSASSFSSFRTGRISPPLHRLPISKPARIKKNRVTLLLSFMGTSFYLFPHSSTRRIRSSQSGTCATSFTVFFLASQWAMLQKSRYGANPVLFSFNRVYLLPSPFWKTQRGLTFRMTSGIRILDAMMGPLRHLLWTS